MWILLAGLNAFGPAFLAVAVGIRARLADRRKLLIAVGTWLASTLLLIIIPVGYGRYLGLLTGNAATVIILTDPELNVLARLRSRGVRVRATLFIVACVALFVPLFVAAAAFPEAPRLPFITVAIAGVTWFAVLLVGTRKVRRED